MWLQASKPVSYLIKSIYNKQHSSAKLLHSRYDHGYGNNNEAFQDQNILIFVYNSLDFG